MIRSSLTRLESHKLYSDTLGIHFKDEGGECPHTEAAKAIVCDDLDMASKQRIQQRLMEFVKQQAELQVGPEEAAGRDLAPEQRSSTL